MNYAPIALFVYNRPLHTQRTVQALKQNDLALQSSLIVFSDSYKNEDDARKVFEVREYIKTLTGFKSIELVERNSNLGLANSIISGINQTFEKYDKIIVLEDDLVTSKYFLRFMNDALNFYADDDRVATVNGYIYPVKGLLPETFFLRCADCWGWATWRRAWRLFEPDGEVLLKKIGERNLIGKFNFNNEHDFYGMLESQACGKINSWAVRWYASTFLANKLSLYPAESLILNIGNDSSGTNCGSSNVYDSGLSQRRIKVEAIPVIESSVAFSKLSKFFNGLKSESLTYKFKKYILNLYKKCKPGDLW